MSNFMTRPLFAVVLLISGCLGGTAPPDADPNDSETSKPPRATSVSTDLYEGDSWAYNISLGDTAYESRFQITGTSSALDRLGDSRPTYTVETNPGWGASGYEAYRRVGTPFTGAATVHVALDGPEFVAIRFHGDRDEIPPLRLISTGVPSVWPGPLPSYDPVAFGFMLPTHLGMDNATTVLNGETYTQTVLLHDNSTHVNVTTASDDLALYLRYGAEPMPSEVRLSYVTDQEYTSTATLQEFTRGPGPKVEVSATENTAEHPQPSVAPYQRVEGTVHDVFMPPVGQWLAEAPEGLGLALDLPTTLAAYPTPTTFEATPVSWVRNGTGAFAGMFMIEGTPPTGEDADVVAHLYPLPTEFGDERNLVYVEVNQFQEDNETQMVPISRRDQRTAAGHVTGDYEAPNGSIVTADVAVQNFHAAVGSDYQVEVIQWKHNALGPSVSYSPNEYWIVASNCRPGSPLLPAMIITDARTGLISHYSFGVDEADNARCVVGHMT